MVFSLGSFTKRKSLRSPIERGMELRRRIPSGQVVFDSRHSEAPPEGTDDAPQSGSCSIA